MSEPTPVRLRLRLYVNREAPEAAVVERNLRRMCDQVALTYEVEVVDVVDDPDAAERDRIVLTPTLVRVEPPPRLRVAGDLSDIEAALDGLGLRVWEQLANEPVAPDSPDGATMPGE